MSKQCCGVDIIYVDNVPGKEYYYCRQCKKEVDYFDPFRGIKPYPGIDSWISPSAGNTPKYPVGSTIRSRVPRLGLGRMPCATIMFFNTGHLFTILQTNTPTVGGIQEYLISEPNIVGNPNVFMVSETVLDSCFTT